MRDYKQDVRQMFLPVKAGSPHPPADERTNDEPEKKSVLQSDDRQLFETCELLKRKKSE
jgi:hypothetical protein